jgi:hypothetical protein
MASLGARGRQLGYSGTAFFNSRSIRSCTRLTGQRSPAAMA